MTTMYVYSLIYTYTYIYIFIHVYTKSAQTTRRQTTQKTQTA